MTTSDLKSALRHVLTKLEKSRRSSDGLLPNLTDELSTAEERIAARLVERLDLSPPIDVRGLASKLGTVSEKAFPIEIDGLCLDLKVIGKRPKIWLSKTLAHVRKRFTLAHEIGHILIPWHTGDIVDELDAALSTSRSRYRQTEAEANRFAAELLMPSHWVRALAERSEHCADLMHTIVHVAQVSFPAAFFKAQKFGQPGYVCAEVKHGIIVRSGRTKGTWSLPPLEGMLLAHVDMPVAYPPRHVVGESSEYVWWRMREEVDAPLEQVPEWREILETILLSIPIDERHVTRQRINAIVGYAIGQEPKGAPVERIYRFALEATQNRSDRDKWVATAIAHPSFRKYLFSRASERSRAIPR